MRGPRFQFGSYELSSGSNELRKSGLRIHIEDQPVRILTILVSRPGDVVTREELRQAIWAGDTHVDFDRSLTRAINKVRAAISDSVTNPRFIETLPKRGYRFVAPVTRIDEPSEIQQSPGDSGTSIQAVKWPRWVIGIAAFVALVIGWSILRPVPGQRIASLAVLPLENVSGEAEHGYFSDGMTDQLIADLSRIPSLRVVSFKSVMRYKGSHKSLAEVARELNVQGIVDGSITFSGGLVRINARLVQFPGERTVLTTSFHKTAAEVLALQNEFARAIVATIGATIRPEEETRLTAATRPVDPRLHSDYLRGRFFANEPSRDSVEKGIAIMDTVVKHDPLHAAAYSTVAAAWFNLASVFVHPAQAMPKAKAAALRAIELDPRSDEAYAVLGRVHLFYDWDWPAAERHIQKAIDLNPNSSEAYRSLACLRMATGQPANALNAIKKSVELGPRAIRLNLNSVVLHTFAEQYEESIALAKSALEWEPGFGLLHTFIGLSHLEQKRIPEAIAALETAVKSMPVPTSLGFLAIGYARADRRSDAERIIDQLIALSKTRYVCPFEVAAAYAALGRNDNAFQWMNQGVADRADCMVYLRSEPWLLSIRTDPRYRALVRKIGFPER